MAKVLSYKFYLNLLWLLLCINVSAQNNYQLIITTVDKSTAGSSPINALKTTFPNKQQCIDYVKKIPSLLQAKGYISASIDTLKVGEKSASILLFIGEMYQLANLRVADKDAMFMQILGYNKSQLDLVQYQVFQEKLLEYFENNGFPFAKVQLDSIEIINKKINAALLIDRGIQYKIDSIRLFGNAKISHNYLYKYLNIEKGGIYKYETLDKINQRLLELPYLQQSQNWDLTMLSSGSIVNLYLQPKKSNQINVLAGFLPDNQQTGKLLFTVDANLQLKNAFGGGESFGLVWQQIQPKSPRLNLQFQQPYMFNSNFGADFLFELFKRDSTFLNINAEAGLRYVLSDHQTGKVSIQNQRSNVLLTDTLQIKNSKRLPDIADVSSVNLGFDYDYNKTNYRFNPRSGNEIKIFISAGNKKIRKSNVITQIKDPSFNYNKLYDSIQLNTYQVRLKLQAAKYFPLAKRSVFKTGFNGGWYESPSYFRNELFQIGGYKLLRGFDEESIFANRYAVGTLEYRYLLGLNSYFFGFTDFGWSNDKSKPTTFSKSYIGAGLGLSFETKGGLFNISFAAGKRNDIDLNLRQSKIHFGYVSIF
jgi:outer membrane protein assembly factor BamA